MRFFTACLLLTLGLATALAQEAPKTAPISDEVKKLLLEAREMRVKQRYTDALEKLDAAEKLAPNVADIYALRGDIYLAPRKRDFALALPQFEKAAQLQPDSPLPKFNLAEFHFVKHEFDVALKGFTDLSLDYPKLPMIIRHLVHYKRFLCELKLAHRPAADQILADNFTFMDDTPAYYFCKAALAFDAGDTNKGNEWVARAVAVFKGPNCETYYDSFKELRWVPDLDFSAVPDAPKKP